MTALWIIAAAMIVAILLWAADTIALVRYTASYRKRNQPRKRQPTRGLNYDLYAEPGIWPGNRTNARCDH